MMTQPAELIDALNRTFGRHKSFRASHAKGFAVSGGFQPAQDADGIDVPLLRNEQTISGRFSIGGGKPGISDKSPTVRGFGLQIGSGEDHWMMALISAPVFFANSAEQFKEFLAARVPDPELGGPNPEKVKAFNAANPNTVPHQEFLKNTPPCACYSREHYHSGHVYGITRSGQSISGRLKLEAEGGRLGLSDEEKASFPDDFLMQALDTRLRAGPVRWTLKLVAANEGDELLDPTAPWDGIHEELTLGSIEIDARDDSASGDDRVFDPSALPQGVDAPRDQIFGLRSAAYAVSYKRRSE